MSDERERLERLAAEIVEGDEIDWREATRDDDPESTRARLESLRALNRLREFAVSRSTEDAEIVEDSPGANPPDSTGDPDHTRVIDQLAGWLANWIERFRSR